MKNNLNNESNILQANIQTNAQTNNERRYDLDWLRVIAFAVLILYHIGMYYVTDWGWHIKSEVTSDLLQDVMILTNPWRMALLFFIGGVAIASILDGRYGALKLIELRTKRLFVPLLFGMFIIVAPQVYIEYTDRGLISSGFVEFWLQYINPQTDLLPEKQSDIGLLTWNHLWFLPYLWVYSLVILVAAKPLAKLAQSRTLENTPLSLFILSLMALLIVIWLALRTQFPTTHDLLNDWYNHGKYFLAFSAGYLLFWQKNWWQQAINHRNKLLLIALVSYAFIIADRHGAFPELAQAFGEGNLIVKIIYGIILSANIWCWILAALGMTGYYLNRNSKVLKYANKAVLPWYLLHQTLIVVFAWWLKDLMLPAQLEFFVLLAMTVTGCLLGYELIKRIKLVAWLSGVKS